MKKYLLLSLLSFSFVFAGSEKPILVGVDQSEFTVTLPSNPSTGYSWLLESYDSELLELTQHDYVPPQGKTLVGAAGDEQWVFHVIKKRIAAQMTTMTLIYTRPWEAVSPGVEKKVVTVVLLS